MPVRQCTPGISSYHDGKLGTTSELMAEPKGFENESEDGELMAPETADDDEESASD